VPSSVTSAAVAAQQKDNLCGPFWAARFLRDAGFDTWDGARVDEDLLALRAGTLLPDAPPDASVPRGAASKADYAVELPVVPADAAGTAAGALAGAIEAVSGGALRCVPLRGPWLAERVEHVVERGRGLGARLLANLRTGRLWGSRPPVETLLAELTGRSAPAPPADWDVGHFCELGLVVRGPAGSLVVVRDSYPSLGWSGTHLQPPRVVAEALVRDDGRDGGVLAVVPADGAGAVETLGRALGLEVAVWDNGTRR
jgi:hypothetical protein